ncbi:rab3 GTPase-activating protein catalytic subunit-like [Papaver somniferum]|uniref:rab3 GTPase-activating protein catalytic subunit-like n=1 Tax=Papaver somniferum TaxID=3469 RepID=UPI000E6F56A4|nr:rab3 GTPase-activating protein catalytic subunit-like [Papaver somniferum]
MASSSNMGNETLEEEDEEEVEPEGFDDFTLASSWERFISEIEAVCRLWLADGPKILLEKGALCLGPQKNLYKVKSELKYGAKMYCLDYYFEISRDGKPSEWNGDLHDMQLSFGVKDFLVIAPLSASGVVLDAPESTKLLSATAIALSNCGSTWPAFVPVHDPSRKAFTGIQNMGTVLTRRFEADHIGSQVPVKLMHLEGLYELFISKFAFSSMDLSTSSLNVYFTMKLTYRTPPDDDDIRMQGIDAEMTESEENHESNIRSKIQWDDDCPWTEWYSAEDPIKGFELSSAWSNKMIKSSSDMAELENTSSYEAETWLLCPFLSPNLDGGNTVGFASQLCLLVNALHISFEAQFMEDFISVEKRTSDALDAVPPPTVLDRVLKDLFHQGAQMSEYSMSEHKSSRTIKGAPLESLFSQFCLHSLWFGICNIRAVAMLWIEFVREVRWCWEELQPLPKMLKYGSIDLSTCLIHQKLQMLAVCIERQRQSEDSEPIFQDSVEGEDDFSGNEEDSQLGGSPTHFGMSAWKSDAKRDSQSGVKGPDSPVQIRRGSAGVAGSMMLINSYQRMHAPYTQDPPLMTEDMHEERLRAVEALGNAINFSAQLERDILSSDMSAFKAANLDAVFEDFIRWHSPGDWESSETDKSAGSGLNQLDGLGNDEWPPKGRLSNRMSEKGNSWWQLWNDAPVLPASEQKSLLDPNQEGEKILHYLETLRPDQLLEQMVCTAFRASADTLNQTSFGDLKQMTAKIGQLYLTITSSLKPLRGNYLPHKEETIADLRRLCVVFENVEKLLLLAASLHRKLSHAPRLSKSIFTDYFNFYLPKMGTSSVGGDNRKEFDMKQRVAGNEREAIMNMFPPPTANQSWRKVLSMGNLFNGHEPVVREIIFSRRDGASGNHYSTNNPINSSKEIETHRMYICGTSNDLRVALAVTSSD